MALGVGGIISLTTNQKLARQEKLASQSHTSSSEKLSDDGGRDLEELAPAALLQRFSDSTDEMSILLAQFRNRRDFEKKVGNASESSFEQVLDDDVLPKVYTILKIASGANGSDIRFLMRQIRDLFPDDSDIVLVLRELLHRRDMDEVAKGRLKKILEQIEEKANPKRLKAGINIALKARLFGKTLDLSPMLMRESYRDFLESDGQEMKVYQDWVASYGAEKRALVVEFMESSLLTDMDAQDPSCSQIEFGYILRRLIQIKTIRSCDALFVSDMLKDSIISSFNSSENEWLLFMFCVLQQPMEIKHLLDDLLRSRIIVSDHRHRGAVLQTIYKSCINFPLELFEESVSKDTMISEFERIMAIVYRNENVESIKENRTGPKLI